MQPSNGPQRPQGAPHGALGDFVPPGGTSAWVLVRCNQIRQTKAPSFGGGRSFGTVIRPTMAGMKTNPARPSDKSLRSAMELLKLFREIDPEMPMGAARAFLLIAADEGMSVASLQRRGGMALSTASRYHHYLGNEDRHHRPGKALVAACPSMVDATAKALRLTPKGRLLAANVAAAMRRGRKASPGAE